MTPKRTLFKPGYLYLVRFGGIYKIGISQDPEKRMVDLRALTRYAVFQQVSPGCMPHLIAMHKVENMRRTEDAVHLRFWRKRHLNPYLGKEWFVLSCDDVAWFCGLTPETLQEVAHR